MTGRGKNYWQRAQKALSDSELLAILISTGSKNKSAVELAKEVLALGKNNLNELGKVILKELDENKRNWRGKSYNISSCIGIGPQATGIPHFLIKHLYRSSNELAEYLQATFKRLSLRSICGSIF